MKKNTIEKNSVVFLCQYFYPEKFSSATLPTDTAEFLSSQGFKVGCVCGYPNEYLGDSGKAKQKEVYSGIDICRIKYTTFKRRSFFSRLVNYFSFTFKCLLNLSKLKKYEYLVVYSNPPILPYVAYKAHKKYGTRIIFVSYDVYPEIAINTNTLKKNGLIARVMERINAKLFSSVEKVVVLSDDMKRFIVDNRSVSGEKVVVAPNWFSKRDFVEPDNSGVFTVTYLGNMGTCQDIQTLLDAALALKNQASIEFVIGGQGNKTEYVEDFIRSNDLKNVELHPFLTGDEYDAVMAKSNCFVVSLERGVKGLCFPSKYYSYLAYGRPVLAIMESNCLTNELLDYGVGYSVENGESMILCEQIKSLAQMGRSEYLSVCKKSYQLFVDNYTREKGCARYLACFK